MEFAAKTAYHESMNGFSVIEWETNGAPLRLIAAKPGELSQK
jgi:hypothetical protein